MTKTTLAVLICLGLAASAAVVYAPVLHFNFVRYDDPTYVIDNSHVNHGWNWRDLGWCFQTFYAGNWHPLTWISHMLDCQLYGLDAGGHHLTNLALHLLNTLLVFVLLRRMTGAVWRSAMVAALFGLHPLHVESVAWISERKDVLSTLFWLLAAWAYVRSAQELKTRGSMAERSVSLGSSGASLFREGVNGREGERPREAKHILSPAAAFYVLSLLFFTLGLLAKPMIVTLPFVLLLLDWWPLERFGRPDAADSGAGFRGRIASLLIEKIPFVGLSIASSVMTIVSQKDDLYIASLSAIPFPSRLINAVASYRHYLEKTIWPSDLGPMYPAVLQCPVSQLLAALLILALISAVAAREWKDRPYWLAGWCWFVGTLVPVIGVFRAGGQPMADRYTYVPSIGLFIILSWGTYDMARQWPWHRPILATLAAAAVAFCCVLSRQQLQCWRDTDALFSRVPKTKTNNVGHANYARLLFEENRLEEARLECEEALRITPGSSLYECLLADILLGEAKLDDAFAHYSSVVKRQPDLLEARLGLAKTLLGRHDFESAAAQFASVLKYQSQNAEAHAGLGQALIGQGRQDEGRAELAEAARLARDQPPPKRLLGSP